MQYNKLSGETDFEWKLRLCLAKKRGLINIEWETIKDILGLKITSDQLRKQAVGYYEYDEYLNGTNAECTKILSISDLHIPFQLDYKLLEDYSGKVDVLQINGDCSDFQGISKFPKVYRISPMEELIETRTYIIKLIEFLKPKKVIVTYGNHDQRFQNYLARNLDSDLLELMPENQLELIFEDGFTHFDKRSGTKTKYSPISSLFDNVEINYVHNWYCQIGDTIFCHPSAFSSAMLKTAEKAMLWFRNEGFDFTKLVMAHTHRSGQYVVGNTTIYEQGCFCDVSKNNYSDGKLVNSQKEGFLYLVQDKNGITIPDKTKLVVLN